MGIGVLFVGFFLLSCVVCVKGVEPKASPTCTFPAVYNFGDSNSDTGGISASFVPIPAPYGEGFFHKPSGRDCDGRLIVDFIGNNESTLMHPYLFSQFLFLHCFQFCILQLRYNFNCVCVCECQT